MNILILIAGTNEPSNAHVLAGAFKEGVQQHEGFDVHTKELKDLQLEHFSVDFYDASTDQGDDFRELEDAINKADGLVIATPIWNFSVPAHLKNALDRIGSFALDESHSRGTLAGLPFYLIFTGGAPSPAWTGMLKKTTSHVAAGLEYFGASHMGTHFEPKCTKGRGVFGLVVDERPESIASVREQGFTFAKVVAEFVRTGKAPTSKRAKSKIMQWGENVLKKIG